MRSRATTFALFLLASPILLLLGGAIVALVASSSWSSVVREFHDAAVREALSLSLRTTLVSLVVIVICGTSVALLISRKNAFSSSLELLVTLPAIMPPSVAGLALLLAFGRRGLIGSYLDAHGITVGFTPIAVVMAQSFVAIPFFVREAAIAFQSVDPSILDAARIDGASGISMARWILLPIAAPFLITGAILSWARALSEFGATILFAGSLQGVTQTLPIAIYIGFETNMEQAKAIALILLTFAAIALVVLKGVLRRTLVYAH
jgi:molybdate transport system permease protein